MEGDLFSGVSKKEAFEPLAPFGGASKRKRTGVRTAMRSVLFR